LKVEQFLEVIIKGITLQRIQFFMLVNYFFTAPGEERSLLTCITNKLYMDDSSRGRMEQTFDQRNDSWQRGNFTRGVLCCHQETD
jgi:hypothetical protein